MGKVFQEVTGTERHLRALTAFSLKMFACATTASQVSTNLTIWQRMLKKNEHTELDA
jgi:hypothetical protein